MRNACRRAIETLESRHLLSVNGFFESVVQCCNTPNASIAHAVDIDRDGDMDLVANTFTPNERVVLFDNPGNGAFTSPIPLDNSTRDRVNSIDSGDLDGDGDIDVVIGGSTSKVRWLINQGDGSFRSRTIAHGDANDSVVRVGDLDGDGDLDIVSSHRYNDVDELLFHENGGDGFFSSSLISTNALVTRDIELIDADRDDDLDIAVASWKVAEFALFENLDGNANFGRKQAFAEGFAVGLEVSDFTGDSELEIVTLSTDALSLHHPSNDAAIPLTDQQRILESSLGVASPMAADFDGDGDQDLVTAMEVDFDYSLVWLENQNGTFGQPQTIDSNLDFPQFESIATGDFNGDGNADVALARSGVITWYDNSEGAGDFSDPIYISQSPFFIPKSLADFDNDGDLDLLTGEGFYTRGLAWQENDGHGTFGRERMITSGDLTSDRVISIDADGDGDMDVVDSVNNFNAGTISIRLSTNEDNGNFQQPIEIGAVAGGVDSGTKSLMGIDYQGDDGVDLIALIDDQLVLFESIDEDGVRRFADPVTILQVTNLSDIEFADVDGDGNFDLVTASSIQLREEQVFRADLRWYRRLADGSLAAPQLVGQFEDSGGASLEVGDVDGDGDVDVSALIGRSSGRFFEIPDVFLAWIENRGDGSFEQPVLRDGPNVGPFDYELHDADSDGDLDAISTVAGWNQSLLIYSPFDHESQTFADFQTIHQRTYRGVTGEMEFVFGDIDGNGTREILLGTYEGLSAFSHDQPIVGDSNHDGVFDSQDLVTVFQAQKYEDDVPNNAEFEEGDWNGDGDFDSTDLVFAFQSGNYVAASTRSDSLRDAAINAFWLEIDEETREKQMEFPEGLGL